MGYAIHTNGGWRAVTPDMELDADETYSETMLESTPEQMAAGRLDALWSTVDSMVNTAKRAHGWDENAAQKVSVLAAIGTLTEVQRGLLAQINAWSDAAWGAYYAARLLAFVGEPYTLPELPPFPCHFYEFLVV